MKANRQHVWNNDKGEVGVGTLIVFIAMVLVAAVAAAVLINTSGTLQQRATQTGKEATQEVSSNLKIIGVYGERATATDDVSTIKVHVSLAAGALPMDLTKLIIRYSDGDNVQDYSYDDTAASATQFAVDFIRGEGDNDVMLSGDLVELEFDLANDLEPRTSVEMLLIPETGNPVIADFRTPSTYGSATTITLR